LAGQLEDHSPSLSKQQDCVHLQDALKLSEEQKAGLLAERRTYLERLSPLLKQRWELHRLMLAAFPKASQPQRGSQAKVSPPPNPPNTHAHLSPPSSVQPSLLSACTNN